MNLIEYDPTLLVNKIPSLKKSVEEGYIKVLKIVTPEGKLIERVVRFTNLSLVTFDEDLRKQIIVEVFGDCHEIILYRQYALMGFEIVGRPLFT